MNDGDGDNASVMLRLKSIQGHIGGVIRMTEEGAYCIDVLQQIQAVQGALDKVSEAILEGHLNSCLVTAVRGDDVDQREQVLKEIAGVFKARRR